MILGLFNIHYKTVANLVAAKMLHCYLLVNTLQMYSLNSTYSPIKRRIPDKLRPCPVADPENFGGGGFEAQNLKNSDVFTKIESDFLAEIGNSNVFFAQIQVVSKKKKKKKGLHQN